jgi:hypothetical protein
LELLLPLIDAVYMLVRQSMEIDEVGNDGRPIMDRLGRESEWLNGRRQDSAFADSLRYPSKDLPKPSRIGIDPRLLAYSQYKTLEESLKGKSDKGKDIPSANVSTLVPVEENLVDLVWESDAPAEKGKGKRPPRLASQVFVLDERFAGARGRPLMQVAPRLVLTSLAPKRRPELQGQA